MQRHVARVVFTLIARLAAAAGYQTICKSLGSEPWLHFHLSAFIPVGVSQAHHVAESVGLIIKSAAPGPLCSWYVRRTDTSSGRNCCCIRCCICHMHFHEFLPSFLLITCHQQGGCQQRSGVLSVLRLACRSACVYLPLLLALLLLLLLLSLLQWCMTMFPMWSTPLSRSTSSQRCAQQQQHTHSHTVTLTLTQTYAQTRCLSAKLTLEIPQQIISHQAYILTAEHTEESSCSSLAF